MNQGFFLDDDILYDQPYNMNTQHLDNSRFYYDLQDWNETYHFGNVPVDILNRRGRYLVTYDEETDMWIIVNERRMDKPAKSELGPLVVRITPIARYKDPNDAIQAMLSFNKVGYHTKRPYLIRELIISYINKENGLHETILGMMSTYGLNKFGEFQQIAQKAMNSYVENLDPTLPIPFVNYINEYKGKYPDSLFALYGDMYDAFVKFNFFKGMDGNHPDDLDLENQTRTYIELMSRYVYQSIEAGR